MRNVIWLVLLATAAVVAAVTFGRNDGLVSIFWNGWRADLSLNLAVLTLLVAGGVALFAAQAMMTLLTLPQRAAEWRALRRERIAQAALREALAEYFSARYSRAHKAARKALELHADGAGTDREYAVLAHLLAAGSLHRLADRPRRDEQLERLNALLRETGGVRRADDGARLAAVEWALEDRDGARANGLLAELPPGVARRTQALRLKLRAARLVRAPLEALHTARLLANHQAFSPAVAKGMLRSLAAEALREVHDADQLKRLWQRLDNSDRRDPQVVARAAEQAARLGVADEGRAWLLPFWERLATLEPEDRERVALALMRCAAGISTDWLPRLDSAVLTFGHEPAVLAAVGAAFAERQLWGKARLVLEQAARATDLPADVRRLAWRRLAALAREEADDKRASACDRAAAELDA
ncbi:MAG: heme biosynthesis protein HemY [Rubrivivax sp.]|nr:heme biosynthesis protein HemY [Rubrivivax sp.]